MNKKVVLIPVIILVLAGLFYVGVSLANGEVNIGAKVYDSHEPIDWMPKDDSYCLNGPDLEENSIETEQLELDR